MCRGSDFTCHKTLGPSPSTGRKSMVRTSPWSTQVLASWGMLDKHKQFPVFHLHCLDWVVDGKHMVFRKLKEDMNIRGHGTLWGQEWMASPTRSPSLTVDNSNATDVYVSKPPDNSSVAQESTLYPILFMTSHHFCSYCSSLGPTFSLLSSKHS